MLPIFKNVLKYFRNVLSRNRDTFKNLGYKFWAIQRIKFLGRELAFSKNTVAKKRSEKNPLWATKMLTFISYIVNNSIIVQLCTFNIKTNIWEASFTLLNQLLSILFIHCNNNGSY